MALVGALSITVVGAGSALGADADLSAPSGIAQPAGEVAPSRELPATLMSLWPGSTSLVPGQSIGFEARYDTRVADSSEVEWTSSDSSVLTVDGNGLVTGVGPGEATIRATDRVTTSMFAAVPVQVRAVSEETGIELSAASLVLGEGDSAFLNALLAPSLQGRPVTWSVSPPSLGTITPDEGAPTASVLAADEGGYGTLSASVTGVDGVVKTSSISLEVMIRDADDFVIDENGSLVGYRGIGVDVTIPRGVSAISPHAFSGSNIRSVKVPTSVRSIGDEAFYATPLEVITFQDEVGGPSQLTEIGSRVFANTGVTELSLPRSLERIASDAFVDMPQLESVRLGPGVAANQLVGSFANTPALTSIEVDGSNPHYEGIDGVLYTKDLSHLIAYPSARNAGGSYAVEDGVETIDDMAFLEAQIDSVTLPSSLRHVGRQSFEGATLTSIALPDGFETMGASAFWQMPNLTRVDLGGAREVSSNAFRYDAGLREINLRPDLGTLTSIDGGAFVGVGVTSITLPDSVRSVAEEAFAKIPSLTSFHVGASLSSLGDYALEGDGKLEAITVSPANETFSTQGGALYRTEAGTSTLVRYPPARPGTELVVRLGVTAIGTSAFEGSGTLRRVVLPAGLEAIGEGAFDGCAMLTELTIPDSVRSASGLDRAGLKTVELGSEVREVRMNPTGDSGVRHVIVRGGVDGVFRSDGERDAQRLRSAFFGDGMTSVTFRGQTPAVLVLPSTLKELTLANEMAAELKSDTIVYVAAPEGSSAWIVARAAMEASGYDTSHLLQYEALSLTLSVVGGEVGAGHTVTASPGERISLTIGARGGALGGRDARLVEIDGAGREEVLRDWGAMASSSDTLSSSLAYTWIPTRAGVRLRVEVRDASRVVSSTTLTLVSADAAAQAPPTTEEEPASESVPPSAPAPAPAQRVDSWERDGHGWRYRNADGTYLASGSSRIDGQLYRFDASGYMLTAWVRDQGDWYYHSSSGAQVTGWLKDGGSWYYLSPGSGAMVTGWLKDGGSWYYLTPGSGVMATGWLKDGGSWYYLTPGSGAMATGTVRIGSAWYRFAESGRWVH